MADANSGDDLISDKDLRYVAAAVQPQDVTQNHQASYDAGFLGFDFCGARPQPITPQQMWELNRVNRDTDFIAQQQRDHVTNTPTLMPNRSAQRRHEVTKTIGLSKGAKVRHD